MADTGAPKNANKKAAAKGGLDTPLSGRQRILPKFSPDPDAFGHATEGFARFMGTPQFLVYMTIFVVIWLVWPAKPNSKWKMIGPFGRGRSERGSHGDSSSGASESG